LAYRQSLGETIGPETPIIREQFDTNVLFMIQHASTLEDSSMTRIVHELVRKSGLRKKKTMLEGEKHGKVRHEVHACHGFRKWFSTKLTDTSIKADYVEIWLGHKTWQRTSYVYSELTAHYVKAIPYLTVREEERLMTKVETLAKENVHYKDFMNYG
jgi:hypothetical protein